MGKQHRGSLPPRQARRTRTETCSPPTSVWTTGYFQLPSKSQVGHFSAPSPPHPRGGRKGSYTQHQHNFKIPWESQVPRYGVLYTSSPRARVPACWNRKTHTPPHHQHKILSTRYVTIRRKSHVRLSGPPPRHTHSCVKAIESRTQSGRRENVQGGNGMC